MPLSLKRAADLSTEEATALHALNAAVYPPEIAETWPGRSIEWALRSGVLSIGTNLEKPFATSGSFFGKER